MNPEERGRKLETLVQMHNYFVNCKGRSEVAEKIVNAIEAMILKTIEEGA